jgi:hypothetical protein
MGIGNKKNEDSMWFILLRFYLRSRAEVQWRTNVCLSEYSQTCSWDVSSYVVDAWDCVSSRTFSETPFANMEETYRYFKSLVLKHSLMVRSIRDREYRLIRSLFRDHRIAFEFLLLTSPNPSRITSWTRTFDISKCTNTSSRPRFRHRMRFHSTRDLRLFRSTIR